jgi:hypothetical protein
MNKNFLYEDNDNDSLAELNIKRYNNKNNKTKEI